MIKPDELVPLMILEWIKGDKVGNQEIIDTVDVQGEFVWVNFHGDGRINGHAINEFMVLIGMAESKDIETHLEIKEKTVEESSTPSKPNSPRNTPKPINTFGFDILDKANRDAKMALNLEITFDFISEDKLKMLLELYGEELFESLKEYVRQQLSEEVITSCIEQYLLFKFPNHNKLNKEEAADKEVEI